jgi:hypothetical protein
MIQVSEVAAEMLNFTFGKTANCLTRMMRMKMNLIAAHLQWRAQRLAEVAAEMPRFLTDFRRACQNRKQTHKHLV